MPITYDHRVSLKLNHMPAPQPVSQGDIIADFRGDPWIFRRVISPASEGRSAKIEVQGVYLDTLTARPGSFRSFYASVFPGILITSTPITKE